MELWLARHGEAVPASIDGSRPLSAEGVRMISAIADSLAAEAGRFDLVASSRKRRARQTAEILGAAAGYPADRIEETDALSPDALPEHLLAFLEGNRDEERVLCVGHLPSIARIASCLLPPDARFPQGGLPAGEPARLAFNPGSVCRIRISTISPGKGELLSFR